MLTTQMATGIAIALSAAMMMHSPTAAAEPLAPETLCTEENDGAYAMTNEFFSDHVESATWVCTSGDWVLIHVGSCYYGIGRCLAP